MLAAAVEAPPVELAPDVVVVVVDSAATLPLDEAASLLDSAITVYVCVRVCVCVSLSRAQSLCCCGSMCSPKPSEGYCCPSNPFSTHREEADSLLDYGSLLQLPPLRQRIQECSMRSSLFFERWPSVCVAVACVHIYIAVFSVTVAAAVDDDDDDDSKLRR